MKRSYSVMSLLDVVREKQYMVLMIVSGRSGSGKSVALRALDDMGFTAWITFP